MPPASATLDARLQQATGVGCLADYYVGEPAVTVAVGGPGDWAAAHGRALETGP